MTTKLVYRDSDGVRRTSYSDGESFGVYTEVDMTQAIANNRALEELHPERSTNKLVARIPMTVYEQAIREGWVDDEEAWRRWLNDPDNAAFRVWRGNL